MNLLLRQCVRLMSSPSYRKTSAAITSAIRPCKPFSTNPQGCHPNLCNSTFGQNPWKSKYNQCMLLNTNCFMKENWILPSAQALRQLSFSGQIGEGMDQLVKKDKRLLERGPYKRLKKPTKMGGRPQLKGVVLKTLIKKPRKPNSANRKCCQLRLSTGKVVVAFIPGEGHNLQEHNVVLVSGRGCKDLIGVHYRVIRGKYDCAEVVKKTE